MDLNIIWFILIAVLYSGFFVLEGFDFGVGMLMPFLGKKDLERRAILNTIGPHWDGNEVWLLTAGGATFAAFPQWYATLFSGFYLPLFLLLMGLILRGVAIEFRSKDDDPRWRSLWDWCIFLGSLLPALLLGVAFSNIVHGVPVDEKLRYVGGFFNLLNPYALLGGLVAVMAFALHGALFICIKAGDELVEKARRAAARLFLPTLGLFIAFAIATYFATDIGRKLGVDPGPVPVLTAVTLLLAGWFIRQNRDGWAFTMTSVGIISTVATLFMILFPRVMVSSLNPAWSLTIYNSASGPYTLQVMTIVAVIFVPVILAYQAWSYWLYRQRVRNDPDKLTY
ncbi:MAG TPA: cytochrome d ubiquinol oxidase subunit II [Anaerolineales bacterium]